jgi:uncharacterized protein YcaQ
MAALSNAKHEAFASALARGLTADAAYAEAGFKPNRGNAARLKANESIAARVADLQARAADTTVTSVQSLISEGWSIISAAKLDKQHAAASQTLERIAKLAGLWVDKAETKNESTVTVRSAEEAERAREGFMRVGGLGPSSGAGVGPSSLPH